MSIKRIIEKRDYKLILLQKLFSKFLILSILFLITVILSYGQNYSAEEKFPRQVALPSSVYKILLKDEDINDVLKEARNEGKSVKYIKKQFFQATSVNINNDKLPDLLVKGQSSLLGANTTHFWIFKRTSKSYVLVFETATFSLSILKSKSKGHRIIETAYPSGSKAYTTYFRFDGKKYVFSWKKEEDI